MTGSALAHFAILLPGNDMVSQDDSREIPLKVQFIHPMEGEFMHMDKPTKMNVIVNGQVQDLLPSLSERKENGSSWWFSSFEIKRPGDHIFFVEPAPFWEPAENCYIIHYTKVVVNAMGKEDAWSERIGLKTEIVPLTRPYGLWTGNVFQGQVFVLDKIAAGINVEVEYLNLDGIQVPADPYITQVVRTDPQGIFTYAIPRSGWWGFAALSEDEASMKHEGEDVSVEIGAVIWVHVRDMK